MSIYGFVFKYPVPDGVVRFMPSGCDRVLVYAFDGNTFTDEPVGEHANFDSDIDSTTLAKASGMGKYKLDIAVRALWPKYANARLARTEAR